MTGVVVSVSRSATHSFSKAVVEEITLLAGLGVEGDVHCGATVRHRYHVRRNPGAPNRCQVHLLQAELFGELRAGGIDVSAGAMGENITTCGIDLLGLPEGARLLLGDAAVVEVTGLREPCVLMNGLQPGLMQACLARDSTGAKVRKAGIMAIVLESGVVRPGDVIRAQLPEGPARRLRPV